MSVSSTGTALLRMGTSALRRAAAGPAGSSAGATGRRAFGAGTKGTTYEGVTIHEPEAWQTNLANGVTALMWYGRKNGRRRQSAFRPAGQSDVAWPLPTLAFSSHEHFRVRDKLTVCAVRARVSMLCMSHHLTRLIRGGAAAV